MYAITMKISKCHSNGEYAFESKNEVQRFLEELSASEIEGIKEITKYNKKSFRSAYYDFFEN